MRVNCKYCSSNHSNKGELESPCALLVGTRGQYRMPFKPWFTGDLNSMTLNKSPLVYPSRVMQCVQVQFGTFECFPLQNHMHVLVCQFSGSFKECSIIYGTKVRPESTLELEFCQN